MTATEKGRLFLAVHWRGVICFVAPIIMIAILAPLPPKPYQWCGYTMALMAAYWLTECIPLEITSFLPVLIFPLTDVMTTSEVCKSYINDIILLFLGSLFLAYAVEQSGLFRRFAYRAITGLGTSHPCMLFILTSTTLFISMWITNTAATALMVPVVFNVLKMFENQGLIKMYDTSPSGEKIASDITTCYLCATTFSASIGGTGTLVGTATNMAFNGLYQTTYPEAPDDLSFSKFFFIGILHSIGLQICHYIYMIIVYFGVLRGKSAAAKKATITKKGGDAVNKAILEERKKNGNFTMWEGLALFFFIIAILGFFFRHPGFFTGWADLITTSFLIADKQYIRDSAMAICVCVVMFLAPATLGLFKNFTVKVHEELPKTPVPSVLNWTTLNAAMPFSFMFLLGGGFALCDAAKSSGLMDKIGEKLKGAADLPDPVIMLLIIVIVTILTNVSSNVVVANLVCPIVMRLAKEKGYNPLWYCMIAGFSASVPFLLPIGCPGNLIVSRAGNIPIKKMMIAGTGPTIFAILCTYFDFEFIAPIIFGQLNKVPAWAQPPPPPASA